MADVKHSTADSGGDCSVTHAKDQGAIAKDDVCGIVVASGKSGLALDIGVDRHDGDSKSVDTSA